MKNSIILFMGIIIFYICFSNVVIGNNLIPEDAIRIRVIPNSNDKYDQDIKMMVTDSLKKAMYNLLKDVHGVDNARRVISSNLGNIRDNIEHLFDTMEYRKEFDINFGLNYFPDKEYKGIKYDEGYYESLVVTIGDGAGDNWWCVLFPPLCLMEAEESTQVEYKSFIKEMIDKYM